MGRQGHCRNSNVAQFPAVLFYTLLNFTPLLTSLLWPLGFRYPGPPMFAYSQLRIQRPALSMKRRLYALVR